MEIRVGKYQLITDEKFRSGKEVVDFFLSYFPNAVRADVEKVAKNYVDKSTNTSKPIRESREDDSRPDAEGVGEKQTKGTKRK